MEQKIKPGTVVFQERDPDGLLVWKFGIVLRRSKSKRVTGSVPVYFDTGAIGEAPISSLRIVKKLSEIRVMLTPGEWVPAYIMNQKTNFKWLAETVMALTKQT